ncbi:nucleoside-diphosphate-sugar epimerase [Apiospora arundinis]
MGKPDSSRLSTVVITQDSSPHVTRRVICMGITYSLGGFLYGYDTGQISGFLEMAPFKQAFGTWDAETGKYLFSSTRSGLIVGLITSQHDWYQVALGRWTGGIGIGALSTLVPLATSESSPTNIRGLVVSGYQMSVTLGILTASLVNLGTESLRSSAAWRITIGLNFVWVSTLLLGLMFVPESPKYLFAIGKRERATNVMASFMGVDEAHPILVQELREMETSLQAESAKGSTDWKHTLRNGRVRSRTLLAAGILSFQQLTGANFFFYYGTSIFAGTGISNSYITQVMLSSINVICTIPGLYSAQRLRRKRCLVLGALWMAVFLIIYASTGRFWLDKEFPQRTPAASAVLIASTALFIAGFASTWGPMSWGEAAIVCPTQTRATSASFATAIYWMWSFLIAFFTPVITARIDYAYGYVFSGCCLLMALMVHLCLVESQGRTIEEVDILYNEKIYGSQRVAPNRPSISTVQDMNRKVKCDGAIPNCAECVKLQLLCKQPIVDYRFLHHFSLATVPFQPAPPPAVFNTHDGVCVDLDTDTTSSATAVNDGAPSGEIQLPEMAHLPPREALAHATVAQLFAHYIAVLGPWYDLNDATNLFSTVVATRALDFPVLFRAVIALSCCHWAKVTGDALDNAALSFYGACIKDLLEALTMGTSGSFTIGFSGELLAASCILRSYEILSDNMQSSQSHLLGAYSFLATVQVDFSTWNLFQAGFWNYLREEITVGLAYHRTVRIPSQTLGSLRDRILRGFIGDDMWANLIAYLLARIMNFSFAQAQHQQTSEEMAGSIDPHERVREAQWMELRSDLALWTSNLPASFEPFSRAPKHDNVFPSEWATRPWHVGALQYASVAEMLLILSRPDSTSQSPTDHKFPLSRGRAQQLAVRVCGLAFTNDSLAAVVNAFGPLIFCGHFLSSSEHRAALVKMLLSFSERTAWPVSDSVKQLRDCWDNVEDTGRRRGNSKYP